MVGVGAGGVGSTGGASVGAGVVGGAGGGGTVPSSVERTKHSNVGGRNKKTSVSDQYEERGKLREHCFVVTALLLRNGQYSTGVGEIRLLKPFELHTSSVD